MYVYLKTFTKYKKVKQKKKTKKRKILSGLIFSPFSYFTIRYWLLRARHSKTCSKGQHVNSAATVGK